MLEQSNLSKLAEQSNSKTSIDSSRQLNINKVNLEISYIENKSIEDKQFFQVKKFEKSKFNSIFNYIFVINLKRSKIREISLNKFKLSFVFYYIFHK